MSRFILDCSIAAAWCFEDEASDTTDSLLERVRDYGATAPSLWLLEITNVLLQAERRGRITIGDATSRLELLRRLPISIEHSNQAEAFNSIITLARVEGLTSYDATYLELAIRQCLPLATLDKKLRQAAKNANIDVLPLAPES